MPLPFGLNFGLGALPLLSDAETRSICAENPDGAKAGGAKAEPGANSAARELGRGWKVRPCITVKSGETVALADVAGNLEVDNNTALVQLNGLSGLIRVGGNLQITLNELLQNIDGLSSIVRIGGSLEIALIGIFLSIFVFF